MSSAVRDNAALSRFELDADGVTVFLNYRLAGNVLMLNHTETPVAARGRGLAAGAIATVKGTARSMGLEVVA